MPEDRRHVAIMFTDIVGYTALMGKDEDRAFDMLRRNHSLHQDLIEKHNGKLIKEIGDGTLASFPLASNAVRCAIEIQKISKDQEIPLKIGIHEGEMVFAGSDVLGDGVNIASRLQEEAQEGCITISGKVYSEIKNKADIRTEFIEEKSLKNVDEPIKIYMVTCEESSEETSSQIITESRLPDKKSIIVLPFVNMSPDPDQEYFSDGLTEEIITDLSYIKDLLVISRSSAMTFKRTRKKVKEIAREVNVRYVLEGSVRKAGNNIRITAQLIDGLNDTHLWAEKYNGALDDVFDIQEKVSRLIIDALKLKLSIEEKNKIAEHPINDTLAYECYMRARQYIWNFTDESLQKSLEYLNHGLEIIGDSVLLYSGMSYVYLQFYHSGLRPEKKYLNLAEEYINKIFKLEPDSAHGHRLYGLLIFIKHGATTDCYNHMKKSFTINPNDPDTLQWLIYITAMYKGNKLAAESMIQDLLRIDPLSPINKVWRSIVYTIEGRFNLAANNYHEFYLLKPDYVNAHWGVSYIFFRINRLAEAYDIIDKMKSKWPKHIFTKLILLLKYALEKNINKAKRILKPKFKDFAWNDFYLPLYMTECYALMDEKMEAVKWLERLIERGWINYPFLNYHDSFLENIRGEKRFKELMEKIKIEWENFEP